MPLKLYPNILCYVIFKAAVSLFLFTTLLLFLLDSGSDFGAVPCLGYESKEGTEISFFRKYKNEKF